MDCDDDYIGKTTQILNERIHEHKTNKDSHIYQHMQSEKHRIDFANIKFLDRASSDLKFQYKERLYFRKINPSLNRQMNSELLRFDIRNAKKDSDITRGYSKIS